MSRVSENAWLNGEIRPLDESNPSIASNNLHLGTSVFDGMMAYWNGDHYYLHCLEAHVRRFIGASKVMGLQFDWGVPALIEGIEALLEIEPVGTQYIRPIAYRRAPELWVTGNKDKPVDVAIFTVPVSHDDRLLTCQISPIERSSSRAMPTNTKVSGNYVNSFLARHVAELNGYDDGIMLDRFGNLAEASAANLFTVKGGELYTPEITPEFFPGITRELVLDIAKRLGVRTHQTVLSPAHLREVDGVFMCSTLLGIKGISSVDGCAIKTSGNELYMAITEAFSALICS